MKSALDIIIGEPWCIHPEYLDGIITIAKRHIDNPDEHQNYGKSDWMFELLHTNGFDLMPDARRIQSRGNIAILPIIGPIFRYANLFTEISGATSLELLAKDYHIAEQSPDIDTIVIWSNSPGGQSTQIADFAKIIRSSAKNTVGFVGDLAASGSYWILSATDRIIASSTALLGSIGVAGTFRKKPKNNEEDDNIEIVSSQSPKKRLDLDSEDGISDLQQVIDDLADVFIQDVAQYRGVSAQHVIDHFGAGGVMIAGKAVAAGMADEVGTLTDAIEVFSMAKSNSNMQSITAQQLQTENPEIYKEIFESGRLSAESQIEQERIGAASAERERIKAILAESLPGHEELVNRLAFDGSTTPAQAALAILHAERNMRIETRDRVIGERPSPVPPQEGGDSLYLSSEDRLKKKWDSDPALQSEFGGNYDVYRKYNQMKAEGRIRANERERSDEFV